MDAFNPDMLKTMQQAFELSKMFDATSRSAQGNADGEAGRVQNAEQSSTAQSISAQSSASHGNDAKNSSAQNSSAQSGADVENNMKRMIDMMNLVQSMKNIASPQNLPPEPSYSPHGNAFADAGGAYSNNLRQFSQMPGASEFTSPGGQAKMPYGFDNGFPKPQDTGYRPDSYTGKPQGTKPNSPNEIHTPALDSIKAAIPHLDERYRRYMSIFVKLIEIQKMMELYSQAAVSMCSGESAAGNWRKNMLEAVKPHMDESKANMIDLLMKLIEMKEISDRMQSGMKG